MRLAKVKIAKRLILAVSKQQQKKKKTLFTGYQLLLLCDYRLEYEIHKTNDDFHFYRNSILDGPVFKVRPNSIEANTGSTVTLVCDVTGNPPPDILWIHEPNEKVSQDD